MNCHNISYSFHKMLKGLLIWFMSILVALINMPLQAVLAANKGTTVVAGTPTSNKSTGDINATRKQKQLLLEKPIQKVLRFTDNPTDLEIYSAAVFPQALVPMDAKVLQAENRELAQALIAFAGKKDPEDISSLTVFLQNHPNSRWSASLEANLAKRLSDTGYLSRALELWNKSWEKSKSQTDLKRKAVADYAISNLLLLEGRLGRMETLRQHLALIKNRPMLGADGARVTSVQTGLRAMQNIPQLSFKCGPFAVNAMCRKLAPEKMPTCEQTIREVSSTTHGTSLAQLEDWAKKIGLAAVAAKRLPNSKFVVPSVVHLKLDHFACISEESNGRFHIQDATFDNDASKWITAKALESETDGYCLIPADKAGAGYQKINKQEAAKVSGKGGAVLDDQSKSAHTPKTCLSCPCDAGGPPPMAVANAFSMNASLNIVDAPLSNHPPAGPAIEMRLNYNYNESQQGSFTFTNLGPDWTLNWISYLTKDASNNLVVRTPGGGYEQFNYSAAVPHYAPNMVSQAQMIDNGNGTYKRLLPDGTVENYTSSNGTYVFMTSVVDPRGQAATITWDTSHYRVTSITDACGNDTTFSYVSDTYGNDGYYKIASISDDFGRSCSFTYDSTLTLLTSITDAAGNVSKFAYDTSSSFINLLTTPYGCTSFFKYVPKGQPIAGGEPGAGLRVKYPDGTTAVIENWIGEQLQSYYWDREATEQYPDDPANHVYSHCRVTSWLVEDTIWWESPIMSWTREPLESPTIYSYGAQGQHFAQGYNKPTQIAQNVTGFRVTATVGGSATAGDTIRLRIVDKALPLTGEYCSYTVKSGDNLAAIATGISNAINADSAFQGFGITATSSGNQVIITDRSTYGHSSAIAFQSFTVTIFGAQTETLTFADGPNSVRTVELGGTITANDVLTITVTDSGISGGSLAINYTIKSSDTLSTVAQNLVNLLNTNSQLQSLGISANWTNAAFDGTIFSSGTGYAPKTVIVPVLYLQSNSSNQTSYSVSKSSGATANLNLTGITMAGPVSAGTVSVTVVNPDLPGGQQTVSYTCSNGESISSVGNTLAALISVDTTLTNYIGGVEASYMDGPGPVIFLHGHSPKTTAYNLSNSALATFSGTPGYSINGTVQAWNFDRSNQDGSNPYYKAKKVTDPIGRQFSFSYSSDDIDLLEVRETRNGDNFLLAHYEYNDSNAPHAVSRIVDGSGQQTQFTYTSAFAELATTTDAQNNTTTYSYDSNGYPTQVNGPLPGNQDISSFTFYGTGMPHTVTDSQGYTYTFTFDALDRPTQVEYFDGTTEQIKYDRLDAVALKDRLNRWSQMAYDNLDQLVCEVDAAGRKTSYCWCHCGSPSSLTDAAGNKTKWHHDLQGRVIEKTYADGSTVSFNYSPVTSWLVSRTDALNQTTKYFYGLDDALQLKTYTNAVNSTSPVSILYDPVFPRQINTSNAWGNYSFAYNPYIINPLATQFTSSIVWLQGFPTTNDVVNITVNNAVLSGGTYNLAYTVTSNDKTLSDLATSIKDAINADSTLSAAGITATSVSSAITVKQGSTETLGGTIQSGDSVSITVSNAAISASGNSQTFTRNVAGSDTLNSIASNLASQITSSLSSIGISASASGSQVVISSTSSNPTSISQAVGGGSPQITITYSGSVSSNTTSGGTASETATATVPIAGGGRLASLSNDVIANSSTAYQRDALGRTINRSINGTANNCDWNFDAIDRTPFEVNSLGSLAFSYIDNTAGSSKGDPRLASIIYPNSQSTIFSYYGNTADQRLKQILNLNPSSNAISRFNYAYNSAGEIMRWVQQQQSQHLNFGFSYDLAGQLSSAMAGIGTSSPNANQFNSDYDCASNRTALQQTTIQTAKIGGTATASDVVTITVHDPVLSGGQQAISYTVQALDTTSTIAAQLAAAICMNSGLQSAGINATSSGSSISLKSLSRNITTYTSSVTGSSPTETVTIGNNKSVENITVGGTVHTGDSLTITVGDPALSGGSRSVNYSVLVTDTLTTIATALTALINADSQLSAAGITATSANQVIALQSLSPNVTTWLGDSEAVTRGKVEKQG